MAQQPNHFLLFMRHFVRYAFYLRHILCSQFALILLGGVAISHLENLRLGEATYFALVTGLTIGYGDIEPVTVWGRVVSIGIGMIGILFTGMYIAVATRALADTVRELKLK